MMDNTRLDPEEQALVDAFEASEFQSDLSEERRASLAQAAQANAEWDREIEVPLSSRDLEALQRRAREEGLSSQSLASSILHKYLSGTLRDMSEQKGRR